MIILQVIYLIIVISLAIGVIAGIVEAICKNDSLHHPYGLYERFAKRGLDAFLATGAIIVLTPILFIISILVCAKLGFPILFTQDRPGRNGKIFKLYKFRTMLPPNEGQSGPESDAQRLTSFGKKLRATSLDELPELINIIKGDMAVVGPRPLLVQYLSRYNAYQARRHEVRPGFTGLAQVHGRNAISWEEKLNWDVKYVDHITFKGDVKIILNTLRTVLKREGISNGDSVTMTEFMGSDYSAEVQKK